MDGLQYGNAVRKTETKGQTNMKTLDEAIQQIPLDSEWAYYEDFKAAVMEIMGDYQDIITPHASVDRSSVPIPDLPP